MLANSTFDAGLNPQLHFQKMLSPSRYTHIAHGSVSEIGDALAQKLGVA